jgi:DNA end-binding protein Ku
MAAGIWKGSIAFGLVNVPVELRKSVQDNRISFRMLHKADHTPIKFQRVRGETSEAVPWGEIVKGYEVEKDNFVVLEDKDFEEAALKQSGTLDIMNFVEPAEIDPRFYERSYFVVPGKGGDRAFALLRDAMIHTGSVGIGKIIIHRRQHLAAVRADGDALVLMLMYFADELVSAKEYNFPDHASPESQEIRIASQLIESMRTPFDPTQYVDEYEENLKRIINAKAKGREVVLPGPATAERDDKILDLMDRLRASLEGTAKQKEAAKAKRPTTRRRSSPRRKKTA